MASGRGSNFIAVSEAIQSGVIRNAAIVGLIVDRRNTGAETYAVSNQIPATVIHFNDYTDREAYNDRVREELATHNADLILTLGYMRLIDEETIRTYAGRMINIHPSLLPAFPGMNSQKKAFDYGVKITGATVHFLDEGMDTGPIILQAAVDVPDDIDADGLADLILHEEHRIIVEGTKLYCEGRLKISNRRVIRQN